MFARHPAVVTGLVAFVVVLAPCLATAGPNAGGVLIVTENPTIYCLDGRQGEGLCELLLTDCLEADTRVDSYSYGFAALLDVVAAFPPSSSPRLKGIVFGIEYDPEVIIVGYLPCGDFELPMTDWPASGSGTAVTWALTQTTQLTHVYSIVAYSYYDAPAVLSMTGHPTQGGEFGDDGVPPNIDPIAAYGSLGFFTDGHAPCPDGDLGACCLPDCSCVVMLADDCLASGGTFQGDHTTCETAPCDWPAGACCFADGSCRDTVLCDCEVSGGAFFLGSSCDQDPCEATPVVEETWGRIKQNYR